MDKHILLQNLKLLYVEDEAFTRKQLSKLLKRRVGKLMIAENGKQGIELYEKHRPEIVIVDLIMPVMGGLEMIKKIREIDHTSFIIVTTAIGDTESILSTVDEGISKYLIKPLDADLLSEVLEEIAVIHAERSNMPIRIDMDQKKDFENTIKKEFSFHIKKATGKGPKEVSAFIHGQYVDIKAYEVLTAFEKSLMENKGNSKYVEMNRKLFYSIQADKIEALISEVIQRKVLLNRVTTDVVLNMDNIELVIK
jgi:YesN/AraC family two-component response regulator